MRFILLNFYSLGVEKTEAVFHFVIPPTNQEDIFYKAEIRVIFPDTYCQQPLTLDLYWMSQRGGVSNGGAVSEKSFFGRKQLSRSWSMCEISVDCTQLLEVDSFNSDQKYSVSLELFSQQGNMSPTILRVPDVSKVGVFAVLCYTSSLLCSESSAIFRQKRQVLKTARKQSFVTKQNMKLEAEHCSRKPLYVDMHDIGWDNWVISPKGFLANQCEGQCPFPISEHLNGTNHALIRSLLHTFSPDVEPACCVPITLKPVTLLYIDDHNNVVLRQYENMAVEECGCR
ncbi:univin-like [Limulus polyphemus]|uniref:Univin-like n=1 Tax=Limulus polyphemus TaxID=6850 RepID=A0ABM1B6R7_LIMPO|nr:univin-like [Limulus polyphemus]